MILAHGTVYPSEDATRVIDSLARELPRTLTAPPLDSRLVAEACGSLAERIKRGEFDILLQRLEQAEILRPGQLRAALALMSRESLLYKLHTELPPVEPVLSPPGYRGDTIYRKRIPLGVLFHIAAGNADALPAYSVVEGLLSGNINLLKLPSLDSGLSLLILKELVLAEPRLAPYVYVFDTPSTDLETIRALADKADGIVLWGGDETVAALRRSAPVSTRLIEWGHRRSFAYATPGGTDDQGLEQLAEHVFDTNQVLCSSCQGVYLDSEDPGELAAFSARLLEALERVGERASHVPEAMRGRITLELRCMELEGENPTRKLLRGQRSAVLLCRDSEPETSLMFGVCWVKPLPRAKIVETLFPHRGYLQTVGLLCRGKEREELTERFTRAGAVRVTGPGEMSRTLSGEAHDGTWSLQRYTKIVEFVSGERQ